MFQKIILASSSIYRQNLLKQIQVPFQVLQPTIDERDYYHANPVELAQMLSALKAKSVAQEADTSLIIGADQIAMLGDVMMPKPLTRETAIEQLRAVSGHTVHFHSGIALYNPMHDRIQVTSVLSIVQFRTLTDAMITQYLAKEAVLNCGCSLKSEGLGIALLERIQSTDPSALIGLPLMTLCGFLANENYCVL